MSSLPAVPNPDDDAIAYFTFRQELAHDFVHLPFLFVPGAGAVEKHLSVVHVQHGVLFARRVAFRQPDIYVSGGDKLRRELLVALYPAGGDGRASGH
jgi:hypothetical protein